MQAAVRCDALYFYRQHGQQQVHPLLKIVTIAASGCSACLTLCASALERIIAFEESFAKLFA
jgi:hypothetical protein